MGKPGLLIYTKGVGKKPEGEPLGKRRLAYIKTRVWKIRVGKPIGKTRLAYIYKRAGKNRKGNPHWENGAGKGSGKIGVGKPMGKTRPRGRHQGPHGVQNLTP